MGWLDGSLVELDVVDARPAEVRSTLLINSLPIHLSKGWEGELPAWAAAAAARRRHPQPPAVRQLRPRQRRVDRAAVRPAVSSSRFLIDGLFVNVDGRYRGVAAAGLALGEVSLTTGGRPSGRIASSGSGGIW